MGAVFAGAASAPITAVVIMFELTREYTIILSLMSAIVLATFINQQLAPKDTIYTLKLRRRGVDLSSPAQTSPRAEAIPISAVMLPVPAALRMGDTLVKAARALARAPQVVLPVIDAGGAYAGTVSAHAVAEALADGEHDATHVSEVADLPPSTTLGRSPRLRATGPGRRRRRSASARLRRAPARRMAHPPGRAQRPSTPSRRNPLMPSFAVLDSCQIDDHGVENRQEK